MFGATLSLYGMFFSLPSGSVHGSDGYVHKSSSAETHHDT